MRIRDEEEGAEEEVVVEIRAPVPKHLHDHLQAEKRLKDTTIRDIVQETLADRYDLDLEGET